MATPGDEVDGEGEGEGGGDEGMDLEDLITRKDISEDLDKAASG